MKVLNKSLALNNESCMFVTFFLGVLDLENGKLYYTNAGHNPPLLIKSNGNTSFMEMGTSIPLGLMEDYEYQELQIQLDNGDKIFAYTDGVSEAENAQNELFGDNHIRECISSFYQANTRDMIAFMETEIEKHVAGYMQSDDITMLTVAYNGE